MDYSMNISLKVCAAFSYYSLSRAENALCTRRGSILDGIINHPDLAWIKIHHHACEIQIVHQDQSIDFQFGISFVTISLLERMTAALSNIQQAHASRCEGRLGKTRAGAIV